MAYHGFMYIYLSQCTMNNIDRVARFVSCTKVRVNSDENI